MKSIKAYLCILAFVLGTAGLAGAVPISVDLSGAASGSFINGGGADFAQSFIGQAVAGTGIIGAPTNPLTLDASGGILSVANFSALGITENSILPQPNNMAPLSILLESSADSISWIMGFGNPPSSVNIDFFRTDGSLVTSVTQSILTGYNSYSFGGFGLFNGLTIYDNDDPAGLRYMAFEYNSAKASVPEPATLLLLGLGLVGIAGLRRRTK